MALANHPLKGSCGTSPFLSSLWSRGIDLNHCIPAFHAVERKYRFLSLKCRSCSSVGASRPLGPNSTSFKLSAFKDNQFDDACGGRTNCSTPLTNGAVVSHLKHKSEESSAESSEVQNKFHAPQTASVESTERSRAMNNLFKSWLMLLRAPLQTRGADKTPEEPHLEEKSETRSALVDKKGEVLKAVWCYIWNLDATIRIPFLVFTPLYLVVNLTYGMAVSKELTPLWILGPLVVALYVKMFRALRGLYAFIFKRAGNVIKTLPTHYLLLKNHLIHGKLKAAVRMHILQHVADIRNTNYNKVARRTMEDLQRWFVERYLDLVEFVWPYYCRTFRVLKRMNLI